MDNKVFDFHEIKTFEDACKRLGIPVESLIVESLALPRLMMQQTHFTSC